jgi:hypothetical protein
MMRETERRLLQASIAIGGCVPVFAGGAGMVLGMEQGDVSLDSHFRYLSGLLFGIGIAFWYAIPTIETRTQYVRLLCLPIVIGGFARLGEAVFVGVPKTGMLLAIGMELVVTPGLCLWQSRIAKLYAGKHV